MSNVVGDVFHGGYDVVIDMSNVVGDVFHGGNDVVIDMSNVANDIVPVGDDVAQTCEMSLTTSSGRGTTS